MFLVLGKLFKSYVSSDASYLCTYSPGEDMISIIIVFISSPKRYKVIIQFHKWNTNANASVNG